MSIRRFLKPALAIAAAAAVIALATAPAEARSKRKVHRGHHSGVYVGGGYGPNTYVRAPRGYGGNPGHYRNVPRGRPDAFQATQGCYGGREQVRRGGQLVWVPNVTCPYQPDLF